MKAYEVKKAFIMDIYGNRSNYLKARKQDYLKVQFEWSVHIDALCKDGIITEKQYSNLTF